ncbi:MAG: hypothetical protein P1S46_07010 [bacterium]|nr:hypothetical protein [bacterium]MDT8395690.1 hypothetical protein [bacterium]
MRYEIVTTVLLALTLTACSSGKEAGKPPVRISEETKKIVQENLASLTSTVTLFLYRGGENENQGEETQTLVDLMARTSSNLIIVPRELTEEAKSELEVDHGPVIELKGPTGGILRYYGFPERQEVRPFLDGILLASGQPFRFSPPVEAFLAGLEEEVVIRIFTTPE